VNQANPPAQERAHEIGWLRAIATGIVVLVVGIGATVFGANRILTKALALTRGGREALASALFLVVVVVLAWALRRFQARGWI
jgi:membrane protein implicated in regulation of membrane protease activity